MLQINTLARLDLGVKDENRARDLYIDMNAWYTEYPNGSVSILHKRNGDQTKYAVGGTSFDRETGILTWTPTAYDTFYVGKGLAEIRITENDVVKKTKDVVTEVARSLMLGSGETLESGWQNLVNTIESMKNAAEQAAEEAVHNPTKDAEAWAVGTRDGVPVESTDPTYHNNSLYWKEQAEDSATSAGNSATSAGNAKTAAEAARDAAQAAVLHYPYVDTVSGNWMVWDTDTGAFVNTGIHAQGPTGAVPAIAVGTVTTLQPGESATVERRSGSPDTAPVFDFGIPKGADGQTPVVYGNTIDMSSSDTTKVSDAIGSKLNANQGSENAGKALGIANDGSVTPVPFSGEDFTGATASSDGVHGYVPAPLTGEQGKFLKGDGSWANVPDPQTMTGATSGTAGTGGLVPAPAAGANVFFLRGDATWAVPPGSKLITKTLDTVTNVSGSYTHSTTLSDVTHDMRAVMIELGDPTAFRDTINITTADGSITLSCDEVAGTSTVTVGLLFEAAAGAITSSEFDVLAARIGTLSNLHTTAKTSLVDATNELTDQIGTINSNIAAKVESKNYEGSATTFNNVGQGSIIFVGRSTANAKGIYFIDANFDVCAIIEDTSTTISYSSGTLSVYRNSGYYQRTCTVIRASR